VWINTPDEKGRPLGHSLNLTSLGRQPARWSGSIKVVRKADRKAFSPGPGSAYQAILLRRPFSQTWITTVTSTRW
jgi:hypothetical protein